MRLTLIAMPCANLTCVLTVDHMELKRVTPKIDNSCFSLKKESSKKISSFRKNSYNSRFLFFLKCWKEISILVMTQPVIENGASRPFSMTGRVITKIDISFQHFRKNKKTGIIAILSLKNKYVRPEI